MKEEEETTEEKARDGKTSERGFAVMHQGRRAAGARSQGRSDRDLVADDPARGLTPDGLARHRRGNDSPGDARSGLQLSAHAHLGAYRLRAARAQERHGDDL